MSRLLNRLGTAASVAVAATALVACGGAGAGAAPAELIAAAPAASATNVSTDLSADPATNADAAEGDAWAQRAVPLVEQLPVYVEPGGDVLVELGPVTDFGTPRVLGVIDVPAEHGGEWVEVLVPVRPNDLTGWVHADAVELQAVDFAVHIDVDARTLWLAERGVVIGSWQVAVGQQDRPTPRGQFFITDKLDTGDPNSVWGPYAFGLSAYSDVLTDFIGGIGQIGLHGTNNPASIGNAASSGCIRLPNEVITELIELLPLGTPVTIV
jgi:lipoprotein-anchoring transpeptidase ErfK/SrfK